MAARSCLARIQLKRIAAAKKKNSNGSAEVASVSQRMLSRLNSNSINNSITQFPNENNSLTGTAGGHTTANAAPRGFFSLLGELISQNRSLIYQKLLMYSIGLCISLIVCASFIIMTYLLRRTLNLVECFTTSFNNVPNADLVNYFNSTYSLNRTNAGYYYYMLNIETLNNASMTLTCDFCYLIVWSASSLLVLVYPFYLGVYMKFFLRKARERMLQKSASNLSQDSAKQHQQSIADASPSTSPVTPTNLPKRFTVKDLFLASLNVFREENINKTKLLDNLIKNNAAQNTSLPAEGSGKAAKSFLSQSILVLKQKKREYVLKLLGITLIWLITGYSYMRAIDLLYCSDLIILFSVNFSLIYMGRWIFLQQRFIPIRVNYYYIDDQNLISLLKNALFIFC